MRRSNNTSTSPRPRYDYSYNCTCYYYVLRLHCIYCVYVYCILQGESVLVADGIIRTMWRDYPSTNLPHLLSGKPTDSYQATFSLWDTA